ncbi:zf-HC2 domain-containing protein [Gilvimarinus polysaccharolyticus]|uniref:zf-HC2 domain-containing protein n=1 Tax=Gilvimarinus polysaccharolyticus TaxID=863921 RepID=UPI000673264D|nr:zf-HC2 domain-containing protein [Gilvimarinus polysaccharolyticus]
MMNCRRATRLMSESKERPLSATERMALRVHTMMCSACRRFDGQLDFLSQAAQRYKSKPNPDDEPKA